MSISEDELKRKVLKACKTIAIVGMSNDPQRTSHRIGKYLKDTGYRIVPVNPEIAETLGEKAYPDLASIPFEVDLVDVFRRQEKVDDVINDALGINPMAIWLQMGLTCQGDRTRLQGTSTELIEDCCLMAEHRRLLGH